MADQCMFVPEGDSFQPTEWAVGRGTLSDLDGAFGACEQTLLLERAQAVRDGG